MFVVCLMGQDSANFGPAGAWFNIQVRGTTGAHLAEEDVPEDDPEAELEADDLELDLEEDLLVPAELELPPESLAISATAVGYQQQRVRFAQEKGAARSAEAQTVVKSEQVPPQVTCSN